jgi:23S rRNA (adenine2503-C2)-methyltransferase
MAVTPQPGLLGLDLAELTALMRAAGEPEYRARQLFAALYRQRVTALDQISTLPERLRATLAESFGLGMPRIEHQYTSSDGTIRYLIAFADGESVETGWMPEGDGGEAGDGTPAGDEEEKRGKDWERATICVSSQVGCAVDCHFCLTATLGLRRNLSAGEIAGQVLAVLNDRGVRVGEDRINLVFMGQGEPFLNYDPFIKAVRLLAEGAGIPERRMTVSTSGIVPRIADLGREPVRPKLAISLNAASDEVRTAVMPLNKKWPIAQLLEAARDFPLRPRERRTFEYVLLAGVNDEVAHARQLAELLRGLRAKVNLIALNPGPGIGFGTPEQARVVAFQQVLIKAGIPAFVRRPRGLDIFAACGQLKRTVAGEALVQLDAPP